MSRLSSTPLTDDDPLLNPMLSASAFDFLLTELVPMTYRIHSDLAAREEELATQASLHHLFPARKNKRRNAAATSTPAEAAAAGAGAGGSAEAIAGGGSVAGEASGGGGAAKKDLASNGPDSTAGRAGGAGTATGAALEGEEDDEAAREAAFFRLDALGYRVGQGLVERFAADQPRPATHLDSIKFICKDLWTRVFRKQIDNLKTNHRGTYVLTDARFAPLTRMSPDRQLGSGAAAAALHQAQPFLWFPCGIIRGALAGLGMNVTVNAETGVLPIATFQIRLVGAKP